MKIMNYYSVLGISRDADLDHVKNAYKKLAKMHHPDVSTAADAESKFKEVAEAYATLKDTVKRASYDGLRQSEEGSNSSLPPQWRNQYQSTETHFDPVDLADLFASFGRRSGNANTSSHPTPGSDYQDIVQITLKQALQGTKLSLKLMENGQERELEVRIPAGVNQGRKIKLEAMGGKGHNGGPDGNIYLHVLLKPDTVFKPIGSDLFYELALTPWEAVLGAQIEIPTIEDSVLLTIPFNTRHNQKLRIKGLGLTAEQGTRGDIFAVIHVETPNEVSPEELKLFRQLAAISHFNPRKVISLEKK